MFVLGAALFQTGLARKIGLFVVKLFSGSETKLMVGVMVLTACMAAFLSNTGTVAILLTILFVGGLQLFFIGFAGEYILSINARSMKRPLVIEEERINFDDK